jgi:hypothetical protein
MPRLSRRTFVATAGASAIAAFAPSVTKASVPEAIRLGFASLASARPLRAARAAGLFAHHGLHDVELVHLPSFGAIQDHLTAGTIHGGALPRAMSHGSSPYEICIEHAALVMPRNTGTEPATYLRDCLNRHGVVALGIACPHDLDPAIFSRFELDPAVVQPVLLPPAQVDLNLQSGGIDLAFVDASESNSHIRVRLALSSSPTIYDLSIDPGWRARRPRAALALRAVLQDPQFPNGMPVASLAPLHRA